MPTEYVMSLTEVTRLCRAADASETATARIRAFITTDKRLDQQNVTTLLAAASDLDRAALTFIRATDAIRHATLQK